MSLSSFNEALGNTPRCLTCSANTYAKGGRTCSIEVICRKPQSPASCKISLQFQYKCSMVENASFA